MLLCVRVYLIALGVEVQTGDSSVASLSKADELLRSVPLKHAYAAILSAGHVYSTTHTNSAQLKMEDTEHIKKDQLHKDMK